MDFLPWLLGALTVLVTQGVTLFADHRRRKWAEEGERRRRVEERSEQAALRLLDLMDEGRGIFGMSGKELRADRPEVFELCHRISREAIMLGDAAAREAMEYVTDAIWHAHALAPLNDDKPFSIAYRAANGGREVLGHLLRGESAFEIPQELQMFHEWTVTLYEPIEEVDS